MSLVVESISKRFGQIVALDGVSFCAEPVYSAGVLLYGQRAGLRAVWRAVRVNR